MMSNRIANRTKSWFGVLLSNSLSNISNRIWALFKIFMGYQSIHRMCQLCQTNHPQLGIKTWSNCCYVCHLYAGHGGGVKGRVILQSDHTVITPGRTDVWRRRPVMRLPKVQVYNESFFMPNLCRERQARKAIRERQFSAIFPLQQYRISVRFHFIPLSLTYSLPLYLFGVFFTRVSRSQTFKLTV